jgi:chemotaxis protein methyltransferase CheR
MESAATAAMDFRLTMIRISAQEMHDFSRYIAEISGIAIDRGKKYLLENRLQPVLDAQGCNSFYELLFSVKKGENSSLRSSVIDAIATNETYFFRDQVPFDILRYKIIPDILDRKKRQGLLDRAQLRIWCAACSTGQEVYSVLMAILETVPNIGNYDIRVLGTDISSKVIARASSGRYSLHEVERGLPPALLRKYFIEENGFWRVRDEVRMLASFSHMNLLEPFYGIGPFDIIFCRNVSIYFSEQNKVELFKKIARILDRDGYLIVGGSESLNEAAPQFTCQRHLKGMYYQRRDTAPVSVAVERVVPSPRPAPKREEVVRSTPGPASAGRSVAAGGSGARGTEISGRGGGKSPVAMAGLAKPRAEAGVVPQDEPVNMAHGRGATTGPAPAETATTKPVSALMAGVGDDGAGDPRPLLESIRKRLRQEERTLPAWERKEQVEGEKTLLEIIRDNNETDEAKNDAPDGE